MRVLLFTKNRELINEVENELPGGFRLSTKHKGKEDIILVDIDTISNIGDLTKNNFTIAITK